MKEQLVAGGGKQAVRVVVLSPWGPLWGDPSPRDLMRLLHGLRAAVAGTTGGVVVTLPTYQLPTGVATRALHTAHCCMRMEAFKDTPTRVHPPEYADAHGVLALRFAARPASLVGGHPEACVYLLKRERHKIRLEKPHLPPEPESVGSRAVRSTGLGCASSPQVDF